MKTVIGPSLTSHASALPTGILQSLLSNLTSMELYGIHENFQNLQLKVARLLARCTSIKTLGLGLASEWDPLSRTYTHPDGFLISLCLYYGKRKLASLSIQTLRLGLGAELFKLGHDNQEVVHYLHHLTTIESLEVLHVCKEKQSIMGQSFLRVIDLPPFASEELAIRHVSVYKSSTRRYQPFLDQSKIYQGTYCHTTDQLCHVASPRLCSNIVS